MNIDEIIRTLIAERDRLTAALNILQQGASAFPGFNRRGRPPKSSLPATVAPKKRARKPMSAAVKKKLSLQMKKRWAERKATQKGA